MNWSGLIHEAVSTESNVLALLTGPEIFKQFIWSVAGIMAALKASAIGKSLFA